MTESPQAEPAPVKGTASLAAAMAAVQCELPPLGKTETGKVSGVTKAGERFSYDYKYADLASISAAIMPVLGKHGLSFVAFPTSVGRDLVLRYHLLHESGESLTGEYPLTGGGTAQQLGSQITYARRYCLCAVTGVAPDKDDDAASAEGERERAQDAQRTAKQAEESRAYTEASNAVIAAWTAHVGEWDREAGRKAYAAWSKGGTLADADVDQLRGFQRWLLDQPLRDAGAPPPDSEGDGSPDDVAATGTEQAYRGSKNPDGPMSGRQRGALFAMLGELGLTKQADQLSWINKQLGVEYESRSQITAGNADVLITALKAGIGPTSEAAE